MLHRPQTMLRNTLILGMIALALGGCSSDANPVRDLAVSAGITGGEPKPAPDFITRTRQDDVAYMPVGEAAPKRRFRARSKDDTDKAEADLNRTRSANEARGLATRRAGASAPTAEAPKPAP